MAMPFSAVGSTDPISPDPSAGATRRLSGAVRDPMSPDAAHELWSAFILAHGGHTSHPPPANFHDKSFAFEVPQSRTVAQHDAQRFGDRTASQRVVQLVPASAAPTWPDQISDLLLPFVQAAIQEQVQGWRLE